MICLLKTFVFLKLGCLFLIGLQKFFIYSGYESFVGHMYFKYFLPDCSLLFHSLNGVF